MIFNRRGSALVVSMMMMVALASVAMVALHKLTTQLTYVSTERKGAIAYRVTESGVYATLALADSLGASGFLAALDSSNPNIGAGQKPGFDPDDLTEDGYAYFDLSKSGSFGYEGFVEEADRAQNPGALPSFDFRVTVTASGMVQPLVGYSLNGEGSLCRFKYIFDSDGTVGNQEKGKDTTTNFGAWKRVRATMYVGPLPCSKSSGSMGTN